MDRDKYGSSGTLQKGKFSPFAEAAKRQAEANKRAEQAAAERDAQRKELNKRTVEELRKEYPDAPDNLNKSELIDYILDGE